jgi:predicted alpha/beta superfamily hydrolase
MTRHLIGALVLGLSGSVVASQQATPVVGASVDAPEGTPVVVPRAKQYDITSRINGETYRIMVSTPVEADPAVAYPVLYLLDGNVHFKTATDALMRQSFRIPPPTVAPAIVVGIGYPTDDPREWSRRRALDLTLSHSPIPLQPEAKTGGGDTFLRMIEEELKPFVMARYRIDRTNQIIYGQSLGGLMALRVLFRNPNAFSSYILSSPSIHHNNREVLADEEAFSKRARAGELRLRVLVTSAADEQYRGEDPKLLAAANAYRMVDNASELADRLAALNPSKITVVRTIFAGETHMSVPQASLSRALRFALPLN